MIKEIYFCDPLDSKFISNSIESYYKLKCLIDFK